MSAQRYTVYTVLGDGNPYDVLTTDDPRKALETMESERKLHGGRRDHAHFISDPDNEERGDITIDAEEAAMELSERTSDNTDEE